MSSDDSNSDKTVFRKPGGGEHTVMKPVPGGRTQLSGQRNAPRQAAPNRAQQPPVRQDMSDLKFSTSRGLNPLVNAASSLLAVFEKTRDAISHSNVNGLHQQLSYAIKEFTSDARDKGISAQTVSDARYLMCTLLDEAVLNTPWGAESQWHQERLLRIFHKETSGGDKVFMMLDHFRESPSENMDLLELYYICLSLGFEGKYRLSNRGNESLQNLRQELYSIIRSHRGEYERELSPSWHGLGDMKNTLTQYVPLWVVASIVGGFLFFSYSGFSAWVYSSSTAVVGQLENISNNISVENRKSRN